MGLFDFLSPAAPGASTPEPTSLLEQHLCLCRKTQSFGVDCGLGVWVVDSRKPRAGKTDMWPATEADVCQTLGWSQEQLLQSVEEHIKTRHVEVEPADYLLCRILNECERRLGQPVSLHPFTQDVEAVLGRESLVKAVMSAADVNGVVAFLKGRYGLGDTVITGRTGDITGEVTRLLRPILAGLRRHSQFLCFEVDNELSAESREMPGMNCRQDYTVIHARFMHRDVPITLCVFSHGGGDREDARYYILATHHPKIVDYLRTHARSSE